MKTKKKTAKAKKMTKKTKSVKNRYPKPKTKDQELHKNIKVLTETIEETVNPTKLKVELKGAGGGSGDDPFTYESCDYASTKECLDEKEQPKKSWYDYFFDIFGFKRNK